MIKEALEYLVGLGAPNISTHGNGLEYSDTVLTPIAPPIPALVSVATLTGFADAVFAMRAKDCLLLVESPIQVSCLDITPNAYAQRRTWATAKYTGQSFPFGRFLQPEEFVIGLRAQFVMSDSVTDDLDYVIRMAANVGSGAVATAEDDGMSQKVTVTRGIALKGSETLKPIVSLTPWRTFPEVLQCTSRFAFRAQGNGDGKVPSLALFEADGGQWKIDAANAIAAWLTNNPKTAGLVTVR